ncbi:hypothetical protein SETIT_3G278800v2 [Setaria italica]|uniref:TATA box-binding protein-associated factor RNA polymerase I subunit B n=1 Tax=Setaria italica TaxID=4555 RepID=A0A368QJM6_SETIT|nr:hypothetical protein SETIT_3G278800v2 [Setaria italica]
MDYSPGGASPDPYGGGGRIHLVCPSCEKGDNYTADDAGDDGLFTCRTCYAVHTTQATAADPHDLQATGNITVRRVTTQHTPKPSEPRDFAPDAGAWGEPEDLAARVRWLYVRGLQVILQRQLEVLVERHRAGALVCGVASTIGRRVEFAFLRSLRTLLPIYSTLAVCFLACHIAREAILPTDIYRWAMEGKIPYLAVFTEVDKLLGSSLQLQGCPLDARQLFRPVQVIGAWQLEAAAGSIAQRVGLRLPSVNFYAIAQPCLKDLSLPWALPAELWLSSNPIRVPTRVCVMAILVVTLRVLYNVNGQGIWENICGEERNAVVSDPAANSPTFKKLDDSNSEEFGMRELLCAIAAAYDKINVAACEKIMLGKTRLAHVGSCASFCVSNLYKQRTSFSLLDCRSSDYSSDLRSYLKYCKEVIFTGITCSTEEEHLTEIFWDMYKARENDNPKEHVKSQPQGIGETTITNGVNKRYRDGTFVEASCISSSSGHDAMQILKSEMQDHGFHYMPPRKLRKSDVYLRYRRRLSGGFIYVAHADYYMLLRAFAKLAEVNVRIMQISVLKLERGLAFIEDRIERSLSTLQNLSSRLRDGLRPVSD